MDRVSTILDEYNNEYSEIWEGDLGTEDLDELNILYPGYREMKPEEMDAEIDILRRKVTGPGELDEKEDIEKEIKYVSHLRKMKTWKNLETEAYLNATHGTLKEEVNTLVVLRRIAKAEVRRNDYLEKIDKLKGIIENLGFDPNEPEEELEAEKEERRKEEVRKKEEEDRRKAAELERKRLAEEAAERQRKAEAERREAEIKRLQETVKGDKEKQSIGEKSSKNGKKKSLNLRKNLRSSRRNLRLRKNLRNPRQKSLTEARNPKGPAEVAEDTIPEDDQPIFSGDSTEIMLKDVREDLT
ncbi:Hypothetical predicted protein, partial [Paramuricea clavata]